MCSTQIMQQMRQHQNKILPTSPASSFFHSVSFWGIGVNSPTEGSCISAIEIPRSKAIAGVLAFADGDGDDANDCVSIVNEKNDATTQVRSKVDRYC